MITRTIHLLALIVLFGTLNHGAQARISNNQSSDLFYDRHWVNDRPTLPSDRLRKGDMFRKIPLMYNINADLFDSSRRNTNNYGNADVLGHIRPTQQYPSYVLKIDPPPKSPLTR